MTAQTYYTGDGQLPHDGRELGPDNKLMAPEGDLFVPEEQVLAPDDDAHVPEADLAEPETDLLVPEDGQAKYENSTSDPIGIVVAGHPETADPATSEYPDATPADGTAVVTGVPGADSESPSPVSVPHAEPESVSVSRPAADSTHPWGPWHEIQATFVDDPRASIELAAGLVGDHVEALVISVREQLHSLQSAWQDDDAGTEDLRIGLQHYRAFWNRLQDFPRDT
jgi:hypothetical protein